MRKVLTSTMAQPTKESPCNAMRTSGVSTFHTTHRWAPHFQREGSAPAGEEHVRATLDRWRNPILVTPS